MMFIAAPLSEVAASDFFDSALRANARQPARNVYLSIETKTASSILGFCSVQRLSLTHRHAEIGIVLEPAAQSKGFGREAFSSLTAVTFENFPLEQLRVHYDPHNVAATTVLASMGFVPSVLTGRGVGIGSASQFAVLTAKRWRAGVGEGRSEMLTR